MNPILQNAIGYTYYDEEKQVIRYKLSGLVKSSLIIEHLKAVEEFSKKNQVLAAIADITALRGTYKKTFDYFKNHYYPVMGKQGQICSAILVSEDIITHFLSNEMKVLSTEVIIRNFINEDEAEKWIEKMIVKHKKKYHLK